MTAYLYNAPAGVAGDVTRKDETNVESAVLGSAATAFGIPVKISSGKVVPFAGAEAATAFYGVLVREVPSIAGSTLQGLDDAIPNINAIQGVAVRGYVNVKCTVGTPARGGAVYVRVVTASGKAIGDFEATSDSTNSVLLTGVTWASDGKDSSNNAELRIAR
jgi:hypothetical protein